jgi:formylglycine-generating enzyme required for sulfatase activity
MGQVYLARDLLLDRLVAIKFIAGAASTSTLEDRFLAEGRALARLAHPNVVSVHRVSQIEGRPYLVSEYVRGQSLDALSRPMPWESALKIGLDLARGLAAVHRQGVLHRDIKPSNAVLSEKGELKILDFGIAKLESRSGEQSLTDSLSGGPASWRGSRVLEAVTAELSTARAVPGAHVPGTPPYMAPEVLNGEPASRRSDLYSLGAVLYELCVGHPPRREPDDWSVRPTASNAPAINRRLAGIIDRCLEVDPLRRYASADEVLEALGQVAPTHRLVELPEGNPYRGLRAFDSEHRAVFFGRDSDVRAVFERIRAEALVVIAGESGIGKSSLCRAGVLPLVTELGLAGSAPGVTARLIPGREPLVQLAVALGPLLRIDAAALEAWIRSEPAALARAVQRERQKQAELTILVFVDQAEELISVSETEEASRFAQCCAMTLSLAPSLHWLLTVRGDFVSRLAALPGLGEELQRSLYFLPPLSPERLREAIVGPARAYGVSFESEEMVEGLVQAGQVSVGSLPLLQFALSELWEARSTDEGRISSAALHAIGGVNGALARHADSVLAKLLPEQRKEARRILLSLVQSDGTRIRCSAQVIGAEQGPAAEALDALVVGRLVVARSRVGETEFELAHESLPTIWPVLSGWLIESSGTHRARQRLRDAAAEWQRLGRSPDALWHRRQLREIQELDILSLDEQERRFVQASRRRARLDRLLPVVLTIGTVLLAVLVALAANARTRAALAARLRGYEAQADHSKREAREAAAASQAKRAEALGLFDGTSMQPRGQPKEHAGWDDAESVWAEAVALQRKAEVAYARAAAELEMALSLEPERVSRQTEIAALLFGQLSNTRRGAASSGELRQRVLAFDSERRFRTQLEARGTLKLSISPQPKELALEQYASAAGILRPRLIKRLVPGASVELPLDPGSYRLVSTSDNGSKLHYPFVLEAGESKSIALHVPAPENIPPGFIYVPPGRFLVGSADEESLRIAQTAPPIHEVETGGYFISRYEVTFAEWIDFLESSKTYAGDRLPNVESTKGSVRLERDSKGWRLRLRPTSKEYVARWGEPIRYEGRDRLAVQDWRRFPVTGISLVDINEYLTWLRGTGRVPGARLCTEWEWERAARGADDRTYTTGDILPASMANVDLTYGRNSVAFGPDEVGSHLESDSPFDVHDLLGNALEIVSTARPGAAAAGRGGCWYFDAPFSARITSQEPLEQQTRAVYLGFRVCAPDEAR